MRRRCSLTISGRKRRARSLCSYGKNNVEIEIIMVTGVAVCFLLTFTIQDEVFSRFPSSTNLAKEDLN